MHFISKISFGPAFPDAEMPLFRKGFEVHEDTASAFALVFVVLTSGFVGF